MIEKRRARHDASRCGRGADEPRDDRRNAGASGSDADGSPAFRLCMADQVVATLSVAQLVAVSGGVPQTEVAAHRRDSDRRCY